MAMKDIQDRINKQTEEKAEADFREACKQACKLLAPFFEAVKYTEYKADGELKELQDKFHETAYLSRYGDLFMCSNMSVPRSYVRMKQAEASKEFIDKVEALQDQVNELYGMVER